MRIKLLLNNIDWNIESRIKKLDETLTGRFSRIYGDVVIDVEHINVPLIYNKKGKLSEDWFRTQFKGDYDSFGLIINRKDWTGKQSLLGHYVDGSKKLSFYVICTERQKVRRGDGKLYPVFEDTTEHELCHAAYQDMGMRKKPSVLDGVKMPGFDNTHYWWHNHDLDGLYAELYAIWDKVRGKMVTTIQNARFDIEVLSGIKQGLLPLVARRWADLKLKCLNEGIEIRMTEGLRSLEQQDYLYSIGRTRAGDVVTNAKAGESFHNYGVAFDVVPKEGYESTKWNRIGELGEQTGLSWGGRWAKFPDRPHFELTLGHTIKDFQDNKVDYSKFS